MRFPHPVPPLVRPTAPRAAGGCCLSRMGRPSNVMHCAQLSQGGPLVRQALARAWYAACGLWGARRVSALGLCARARGVADRGWSHGAVSRCARLEPCIVVSRQHLAFAAVVYVHCCVRPASVMASEARRVPRPSCLSSESDGGGRHQWWRAQAGGGGTCSREGLRFSYAQP